MSVRPLKFRGITTRLEVGDIAAGRRFYARLFGREPDFAPHEDFLEWQVVPDSWLQVVETDSPTPLPTRMRLGVDDLGAAVAWAAELDVSCADVSSLPGVVAFTDFADPWGNPWGFFQDLAPVDEAPVPGGSVHDQAQFRSGVARE